MQRERSTLNSFPEPIDLNQGSLPDSTSMDHSAPWNNMMNPVENRLSSYMLGGTDGNVNCNNAANDTAQRFSGWDRGESSSSADNIQDVGDSKTRLGWSSSEDFSFEPSNISSTSYVGNQMTSRPLSLQNYSSNRGSLNLNLNQGHSWERDSHSHGGPGACLPHNLYMSAHPEMEQTPTVYASSCNVGTFSGSSSTTSENHDASGPSFGTWGSSCKRKALEGTSRQFYPGGSSSSNQEMPHPVPGCYNTSGNLSISSGPGNLSPVEQLNPSSGVGMTEVVPGLFVPSNFPGVAERSARAFSVRSNHGRHESVPFDTHRGTSARNSSVYAAHLSRPIANANSSEPVNQNNTLSHPHVVHVNEARGTHSYPWNGSFTSRGGSSSSSFMVSRAHEEVNVRGSHRNNPEYPMTVSAPETINVPQDQIDWSFVPGTSSSSTDHPSGSRSRSHSAAWLPHQNQALQNNQRSSESFPWIPFQPESGTRRNHFSHLPSASYSSDEAASARSMQQQLEQRMALLIDSPDDDINGWRALAAVEGRHRLVRQVLNAMRRGVHLQAEDYMLVDPLINGLVELHDRHRDLRLDVDNMSYEELLALEERIGNVSTGLTDEQIMGSMKQRKYVAREILRNLEPCCVCQEVYITGDNIGILDCGHEFHTSCIKQWLMLKNLCPICKMTALKI